MKVVIIITTFCKKADHKSIITMTLDPQPLSLIKRCYFSLLYFCPMRYLNNDHDLITLKDQVIYFPIISLLLCYPITRFSNRLREERSVTNLLKLLASIFLVLIGNAIIYLDVIFILPIILLFILSISLMLGIVLVMSVILCIFPGIFVWCCQDEPPSNYPKSFDEWLIDTSERRIREYGMLEAMIVCTVAPCNLLSLILFASLSK